MKKIAASLLSLALYVPVLGGCNHINEDLKNSLPEETTNIVDSLETTGENTPENVISSATNNTNTNEMSNENNVTNDNNTKVVFPDNSNRNEDNSNNMNDFSNQSAFFYDPTTESTFYGIGNSYSPTYINRPADVFYTIDFDTTCFYIEKWDEYRTIPLSFVSRIVCASVYTDTAWIISQNSDNAINSLEVWVLKKGCEEIVTYTIDLGKEIWLNNLFCDFTDDQNGYLFVFEEIHTNASYRFGDNRLTCLLKTSDSGKTWSSIACQAPPIQSQKHSVIMANFFDDQIGMISYRFYTETNFEKLTYLTFNGGKTWNFLSGLSETNCEISNFDLIDGKYLLTLRKFAEDGKYYIQYSSADMKFWDLETIIE